MKEGIHPENYRLVAFKDMSNDDVFITKSTVLSKDTIKHKGVTYPLVKLEISRTSHPYYTGKTKLMEGIEKFRIGGTASSGYNGVYDGKIDEFRIKWNRLC